MKKLAYLVAALGAIVIAAPVGLGIAIFVSELAPAMLQRPLAFLTELLAAIPSIVYGLWGVFVLGPKLLPIEKWVANTFSFIPFIGGGGNSITAPNYFIAGLILAIMILPIVSAISREVLATVPSENKEAALALGVSATTVRSRLARARTHLREAAGPHRPEGEPS